jgi:hypothetical protein
MLSVDERRDAVRGLPCGQQERIAAFSIVWPINIQSPRMRCPITCGVLSGCQAVPEASRDIG